MNKLTEIFKMAEDLTEKEKEELILCLLLKHSLSGNPHFSIEVIQFGFQKSLAQFAELAEIHFCEVAACQAVQNE